VLEPLQTSVEATVNAGVLAYRNRDFKNAIEYLQKAAELDPENWRAKLYLGMSYYHSEDVLLATNEFRFLTQHCSDQDIRDKAETALAALKAQSNIGMPEMTQSFKKPTLAPRREAGESMEWIPVKRRSN